MRSRRKILFLAVALVLAACASGPLADGRLDRALALGKKASLEPAWIPAGSFTLLTQMHVRAPNRPLRLYIEGDGFAYREPGVVSVDPSPHKPLALELASADHGPNVAWIARPCQYAMIAGTQKACAARFWTTHRMAPEVVDALDSAITTLSQKAGASTIELVGYSGGGAAAVLLAARRTDVTSVRTVAGNLDLNAFTQYHKVDPMTDSLDAKPLAERLRGLPQIHFVGEKDPVVPPSLTQDFITRASARVVTVKDADHENGWIEAWPRLVRITPMP